MSSLRSTTRALTVALALGAANCAAPMSTPDVSAPDATPDVMTVDAPSCPSGQTMCGATCVDTQTSTANCGACDRSCTAGEHSTAACRAGSCVLTCATGFEDCDRNASNGCETDLSSTASCGACGRACAAANATATCTSGACGLGMCNAGFADCNTTAADGCEANTNSDRLNCGACGNACPAGQVCSMGACTASCRTGLTDCNGSCRDLQNDPFACGTCGMTCPATGNTIPVCSMGACRSLCSAGFSDCNNDAADGCESELASDTANCGRCGRACSFANAAGVCAMGMCAMGACNPGFADCDGNAANGCEVDTRSSISNCGACGTVCSAANATSACTMGACGVASCNAGFGNCDGNAANGCEVNTNTTVAHCGGCGRACSLSNATPACAAGACSIGSCAAGFGNCDGNTTNGCEAPLNSNSNCGACGRVCGAGTSCMSGTCMATTPVPCFTASTNATAPWVVCTSNATSAWISHAQPAGGSFSALAICQSLGYTSVAQWGGTCGSICGYCTAGTSCTAPQASPTFDSGGGDPRAGAAISTTVMWRCAR